jgi:hypothetical protein
MRIVSVWSVPHTLATSGPIANAIQFLSAWFAIMEGRKAMKLRNEGFKI